MIQNSYEHGHNEFVLPSTNIAGIGHTIHGKKGRRLKLTLEGNVGSWSFFGNKDTDIIITGRAEELVGSHSSNSSFQVNEATNQIGWCTSHCNFLVDSFTGNSAFKLHLILL